MKPRIFAAVSLLLCAMATGTVANEKAQLPDMSHALEARIDGKMNDMLNGATRQPGSQSRESAEPTIRSTEHGRAAAPVRTDGGSWKPYHSAM